MGNAATDYDALAKQYGATSSTPPQTLPATLPKDFDKWDALAAQHGGTAEAATPSFLPFQVKSSLADTLLGALAPQRVPRSAGAGRTQGDLPGFEGSYASGDEDKGLFMTGAGVASGAALVAPGAVKAVGSWAAQHPLAAGALKKVLYAAGAGEVYKHSKWLTDLLP